MKLEIEKTADRGWLVRYGERWEDQLGFDEALGVCAKFIISGPDELIPYLKTDAQHEALRAKYGPWTDEEKAAIAKARAAQRKLLEDRRATEAEAIFPNVRV